MSCSKPLPPFTYDVLCSLNRDQLERLSIVCRPLKNFIDRYFQSKPYRIFNLLEIRGGSYALYHNRVQWHPNRDDYSVQQFLDGQNCSIDPRQDFKAFHVTHSYYSFTEMLPYLGPTVRTKTTRICIDEDFTYNSEHIAEMESIAYLWRDGEIQIDNDDGPTVAEDILPILNSPTILQCRVLDMFNAQFSFKDYKILFTVKIIETCYYSEFEIDPIFWLEFLEQPGVKPVVVLEQIPRRSIDTLLERLSKVFSSAISPNAFKIIFSIYRWGFRGSEPLTKFRETNKTSGEILELKEGLSTDYPKLFNNGLLYTLERTII